MPLTLSVGRDPKCDLVLADTSVSRAHADLVVFEDGRLFVRDVGSQNGTTIVRNGARRRCTAQFVEAGDSVVFGDLELPLETLREMAATPVAALPSSVRDAPSPAPGDRQAPLAKPADDSHRTQPGLKDFLPAVIGFDRLWRRGLLLPIAGFAALVALLFGTDDPQHFINIIGVGICVGTYVLIYRSCGKRKPWAMIGVVMAAEAVILLYLLRPYAFVFRTTTGAEAWAHSKSFLQAFIGNFVGAGLMEELMKMTPVLILIAWTRHASPGESRRWGVSEPLDTILYACAAATMFVMLETLKQYVPDHLNEVTKTVVQKTNDELFGVAMGYLQATQLAIARTLDSASGHLAFSGYFGYYIGLGLLKPRHRTRYWVGGYIGAAAIHGLANALTVFESVPLSVAMNFLAVSFLAAVILNARKISPTRDENFATKAYRSMGSASLA